MSEISGKVSVQAKIAELENRIAALEKLVRSGTVKRTRFVWDAEANSYWKAAWKNFDQFFDKVFR